MQTQLVTTRKPMPARSSRMSLSALVKGRQKKPVRSVLYGPEGIGKSTFGAGAPGAIFLGLEDGTAHLDVTRFPSPESFEDVRDAIDLLINEEHEFQTLVIDTVDWLEPLLWDFICRRDKKENIEDYGYGKGYVAALSEWRVFLASIERLQAKRGMHLVLLAHAHIRPFKNPEGEDYDRYQLKLHDKAASLIKEWCDDLLFAQHATYTNRDKDTKRVKAVSDGARFIHTVRTAAFDAKNRHNLPETLPLSWEEYWAGVEAFRPADPETMRQTIAEKAAGLPEDLRASAAEYLEKAGSDVEKLVRLNNWVNTKLAQ